MRQPGVSIDISGPCSYPAQTVSEASPQKQQKRWLTAREKYGVLTLSLSSHKATL